MTKNENNLKKGKDTRFKPGADAAERGRRGGKKNGENAKKRRALREIAEQIASLPVADETLKEILRRMDLDADSDYATLAVAAMAHRACLGDAQAFDRFAALLEGQRTADALSVIVKYDYGDSV